MRLYRESDPKPVIAQLAGSSTCTPRRCGTGSARTRPTAGERHDRPTTEMLEENRRLRAENAELRRVNEVLRAASAYFASEIGPTRRRS